LIESFNLIYSEIETVKNLVGGFSKFSKEIVLNKGKCRVITLLKRVEKYLKQMKNIN